MNRRFNEINYAFVTVDLGVRPGAAAGGAYPADAIRGAFRAIPSR